MIVYLETVMPQPGAHGTVYDDRQRVNGMQPKHHWKYCEFCEDIYVMVLPSSFRLWTVLHFYETVTVVNSILVRERILTLQTGPSKKIDWF